MSQVTTERPVGVSTSTRLVSLDVLRGITIAFMIIVNNSSETSYWPFKHAQWNGWTPTDMVFPTFLFVMGTSLVFSIESRLARGATRASLLVHALKRFVILFLFGLVVNGFPHFPLGTLRIYGVLQRIAICFLIGSVLYLWDRRATSKIVIAVVALVGYWILMRWVPVPGYGIPGHDIPLLDPDRNLVAWLDRHLLPGRLYEGVRDPEGFLSTLPAVGTMLFGLLTALWLRSSRTVQQKCVGLFTAGITGIGLGKVWNIWFPINKKLWTSSYVLLAAGIALVALAICYWLVEIKGWKRGWTGFWLVLGSNAITAYMISEILSPTLGLIKVGGNQSLGGWIYSDLFAHIHPAGVGALAWSICFMLVCWIPAAILYRRKIFIKI
jgi:predicted acyltransferase